MTEESSSSQDSLSPASDDVDAAPASREPEELVEPHPPVQAAPELEQRIHHGEEFEETWTITYEPEENDDG